MSEMTEQEAQTPRLAELRDDLMGARIDETMWTREWFESRIDALIAAARAEGRAQGIARCIHAIESKRPVRPHDEDCDSLWSAEPGYPFCSCELDNEHTTVDDFVSALAAKLAAEEK